MDVREVGRRGEGVACSFLEKKGYLIVVRNFRCKGGEIDIIALSTKGVLCFVEVKTYKTNPLVDPLTVVGAQWNKIQKAAFVYLSGLDEEPQSIRFDVVLATVHGVLQHVRNVG